MDYANIDPDSVLGTTISNDARELENRALMLEYEALRLRVIAQGNKAFVFQAQQAQETAEAARKEADAFRRDPHADFDDDALMEQRRAFVTNALMNIESQHLSAKARADIRRAIGMRVPDADDQMTELDAIHSAVIAEMQRPLLRPAATKRTNGGKSETK